MGKLLNIITPLHKKTSRNCIERMNNDKVHCMEVAGKFGQDFWDGERKYGYGGYKYDGRWEIAARKLIETYRLDERSQILDVGCGKGYLLYEIKKILPGCTVRGFDISEYAIKNAKPEIAKDLFVHQAQDKYPFKDREFDLAISISTLHNLYLPALKSALQEIERVAGDKYVVAESYRNAQELFNLECWALTCRAFFSDRDWVWLFNEFGYTGDYEFIYFE